MQLEYTVTAQLPSRTVFDEYVDWLVGGHAQMVMEAGALSARVVIPFTDDGTMLVRCSYIFQSRAAFDRYVRERAPRLRQEGLERFPASTGIVFLRETADVRISI